MFGITSSGCFLTGIIVGFILAALVGVACIFYFNPTVKEKSLNRVEEIWSGIKTNVDGSIEAVKNAPTAEPQIPVPAKPAVPQKSGAPSPAGASGSRLPKIEIKLGI